MIRKLLKRFKERTIKSLYLEKKYYQNWYLKLLSEKILTWFDEGLV